MKTTLVNFRDMGGLQAGEHTLRERKIFRTAVLDGNNDERKYLDQLGLDAIVDLRNTLEAKRHPDYLPCGCRYISAPILEDCGKSAIIPDNGVKYIIKATKRSYVESYLEDFRTAYQKMPFAPSYRHIFDLMKEGKTFAFHCSAGKDRTGVGAMLILLLLGSDEKTIIDDYMMSNDLRKEENAKIMRRVSLLFWNKPLREAFRYCTYVDSSAIISSMNAIKSRYTALSDFFYNEYGITPDDVTTIRAFYLK